MEEYSLVPLDVGPYNNCCDNIVIYPAVPVAHPTEIDKYPTVLYAVYPTVDLKGIEGNSVLEKRSEVPVNDACEIMEHKNETCKFFTSSPAVEGQNRLCARECFHKFDETLSECDPPEDAEEHSRSWLSSASNASFEADDENTRIRNDLGYFGSDGCWYPSMTSNSSLESENNFISDSIQVDANESPVLDGVKNVDIIPPSKLMMPKPLMSYYNYYQRLDMPSAALGRPHLVHTFPVEGNISIEDLWLAHMKLLFRNFPDKWNLRAAQPSRQFDNSWNVFKDLAKVRFYCQNCLDGWTSMFGVVVFFYSWCKDTSCGEIWYQVSGQKCSKCSPDSFEMPLWYPEEAQKVVTNLYYEIAAKCYGFRTPQHIRTRRLGQPINQHNKSLCQGCTHGLCKQDSTLNSSYTPESPNKYTAENSPNSGYSTASSGPTYPMGVISPYASCMQNNSFFPMTNPVPAAAFPNTRTYYDPVCHYPTIPYASCVPQMAIFYPFLNY